MLSRVLVRASPGCPRYLRRLLSGLVLMMTGCLVLSACGAGSRTESGTGTGSADEGKAETRSAEVVFVDFLDTMEDVVQHSGTTWPSWDRQHTRGYFPEVCGVHAREDGRAYQRQIEGGPVADPKRAVELMKAHWESKGYEIGNTFDNMGGNTTGRQINATTPSGLRVQFTPGGTRSTINVESDCTLDPAAKKRTT